MNTTLPLRALQKREIGSAPAMLAVVTGLLSPVERDAVLAGVAAADAALTQFEQFKVLRLFVGAEHWPSGDSKLDALRAYAELRRALLPQGYSVAATSLLTAGFTVAQIAEVDTIIEANRQT